VTAGRDRLSPGERAAVVDQVDQIDPDKPSAAASFAEMLRLENERAQAAALARVNRILEEGGSELRVGDCVILDVPNSSYAFLIGKKCLVTSATRTTGGRYLVTVENQGHIFNFSFSQVRKWPEGLEEAKFGPGNRIFLVTKDSPTVVSVMKAFVSMDAKTWSYNVTLVNKLVVPQDWIRHKTIDESYLYSVPETGLRAVPRYSPGDNVVIREFHDKWPGDMNMGYGSNPIVGSVVCDGLLGIKATVVTDVVAGNGASTQVRVQIAREGGGTPYELTVEGAALDAYDPAKGHLALAPKPSILSNIMLRSPAGAAVCTFVFDPEFRVYWLMPAHERKLALCYADRRPHTARPPPVVVVSRDLSENIELS
jgi:hypothetical protein